MEKTGWICPKCGCGVNPNVDRCPCVGQTLPVSYPPYIPWYPPMQPYYPVVTYTTRTDAPDVNATPGGIIPSVGVKVGSAVVSAIPCGTWGCPCRSTSKEFAQDMTFT